MENINSPPRQGNLITFDGPDGVGKSTIVKLLAEKNGGIYYKTPGTATMKERNRYDQPEISVQERFNFYIGLLMQDAERIRVMLDEGNNVFCDRFIISTIVHHKVLDSKVDTSKVQEVLKKAKSRCSIILYGEVNVLMQRIYARDVQTIFELNRDLVERTQRDFLSHSDIHSFDNTIGSIDETVGNIMSKLKDLKVL